MSSKTNSLAHIRHGWMPLVAAVALAPVADGANTIALAAWLFPLFLLRFVRLERPFWGLLIAYIVLTGAFAFQFRSMLPLPGVGYYLYIAVQGLLMLAPFALDRLFAVKRPTILGTLVFPFACVSVEYLVSLAPFGTWGARAYTQAGNLPVMQLLSVTGLWGITFLIAWFAAGANAIWEHGLKQSQKVAWVVGTAVVVVFLAGGVRLAFLPPRGQTVRVASLSARDAAPSAKSEGNTTYRTRLAATNRDLLERAGREMQAGAKIVFWAEGNASVFKADEAAFVAQGGALAKRYHAYLGMALAVIYDGHPAPFENKLVLVGPDGKVVWSYNKTMPVPGPEASMIVPGDQRQKVADTAYGRLSGIICFDGDFPSVVARAGMLRADFVLDPANDWRAIDPWHTQMASFRAVEQGFSLIRQTSHGLSAAYDYEGHVLATMDHYQSTDHALVAQMPIRGVRTLYTVFGDWLAWASLAGLAALVVAKRRL